MLSKPNLFRRRSAFTLVEILVTTLVMLIMVLAISQMFALVGAHVTDGRALIEIQGQLRNASFRIQEDLDGCSVVTRQSPEFDLHLGYFEYIEGVDWDLTDSFQTIGSDLNPWWVDVSTTPVTARQPYLNAPDTATLLSDPLNPGYTAFGDLDDVIMFTARSTGRPFVGRSPVGTIESHDAEIIYWLDHTDGDADGQVDFGEITLCRRVLLIRPDLSVTAMPTYASLSPAALRTFYSNYDLSVHPGVAQDAMGNNVVVLVPNSLTDLARRENRVAHLPNVSSLSPAAITPGMLPLSQATYFPNLFIRLWLPPTDDVVVADVLAFDVRAWDPTALVRQDDDGSGTTPIGDLLRPGDVEWDTVTHNVGNGAFVDLNYLSNTSYTTNPGSSWFSGAPDPKSQMSSSSAKVVAYDTWTWAYEHDGIDQDDSNTLADEATDGLDGDSLNPMTGAMLNQVNGVDDPGERETQPPYLSPLRGIQITLRVIELDTRQVRQSTVVSRLMPE